MYNPPRIDAHQHFWQLSRGDYGWLTPDMTPLYRDFGPAEMAPHLASCGIAHTVLVQAAPSDAETDYLLALAARHDFIAGVVGWCDFEDAEAPVRIEQLAEAPKLVGLRPMIQDIADPDWILHDTLAPAFETMLSTGLCFDALVQPRHLANLHTLLLRYPDLRIVIDHGAKPCIRDDGFDVWAPMMECLAGDTRAFCKLSGLITEDGPAWHADRLRPYVDHLLACFGAERLIWGSDWPVLTLAGGYEAWHSAARELLCTLGEADLAAVFGGNAEWFFRLQIR